MRVAVNVQNRPALNAVYMNRNVRERHLKVRQEPIGVDTLEELEKVLVLPIVVVPEDEHLGSIETSQRPLSPAVGLRHVDITEMVHLVLRLHDRIPPRNHSLVHLLYRGERAIAVGDDVGVTEVSVTGDKYVLHFLALLR